MIHSLINETQVRKWGHQREKHKLILETEKRKEKSRVVNGDINIKHLNLLKEILNN
jgi:hypothetical protein